MVHFYDLTQYFPINYKCNPDNTQNQNQPYPVHHVQVIVQVVIRVLVVQVVVVIRRKDNHPDPQYSIQSEIVTVTTYALIDNTIQRINQSRISN